MTRWKIAAAGVLLSLACVMMYRADVSGQSSSNVRRDCLTGPSDQPTGLLDIPFDPNRKPVPAFYGAAACNNQGCHGGGAPKHWLKDKELITRGNEGLIFEQFDKHTEAFKVLTGKRGQQMSKILGYDVTRAKACLTCHSTYIEDPRLARDAAEVGYDPTEGVTCATCHGPYEDWVSMHGTLLGARRFRRLTPEQKERHYGMTNLRDPIRQAELCASCHVGNLNHGKFVTHEMYAAGHPPLPSFEVATFAQQEPPHWQYLIEKSPALQRELGLRAGELERTQLLVVGSFINLREAMRLLITQSCEAKLATDEDKKALDLSNFDCWSCHHGIRTPGWRQERGYKNTPGRPPWRSWPAEMIPAAVAHLGEVDRSLSAVTLLADFEKKIDTLEKAFDARVYGVPLKVEAAAADLEKWADLLAVRAKTAYATHQSAASMLATMPVVYGKRGNDYDSARQVTWAFGTVYDEVHGVRGGDLSSRANLGALDKLLQLRLPTRGVWVEDNLDSTLHAIKNYAPGKFRPLYNALKP